MSKVWTSSRGCGAKGNITLTSKSTLKEHKHIPSSCGELHQAVGRIWTRDNTIRNASTSYAVTPASSDFRGTALNYILAEESYKANIAVPTGNGKINKRGSRAVDGWVWLTFSAHDASIQYATRSRWVIIISTFWNLTTVELPKKHFHVSVCKHYPRHSRHVKLACSNITAR